MTSREVSFVVTEEYRAWIENIKQKTAKWGDSFLPAMSKDLKKHFRICRVFLFRI